MQTTAIDDHWVKRPFLHIPIHCLRLWFDREQTRARFSLGSAGLFFRIGMFCVGICPQLCPCQALTVYLERACSSCNRPLSSQPLVHLLYPQLLNICSPTCSPTSFYSVPWQLPLHQTFPLPAPASKQHYKPPHSNGLSRPVLLVAISAASAAPTTEYSLVARSLQTVCPHH